MPRILEATVPYLTLGSRLGQLCKGEGGDEGGDVN